MQAEPDRSQFWRELRAALIVAKEARNIEARDALLDQAGQWAERLADTATFPEPREQSYFLDVALSDIGSDDWAIPL